MSTLANGDADAIVDRLRRLFFERFHVEVPSPDTELLETGLLDSLQLVELILQIETQFDFRIRIEDIELDDLRTLTRISRLLAAHAPAAVLNDES